MPCGNIGTSELLIISIILLILFGAKRLPALARSIGMGINEFKKGLNTEVSDVEDFDNTEEKPSRKKHTKASTSNKKTKKQ